eukprot:GFUD01004336.1.p1 GENE.GFUD01004336.1~~GFUD01004336.1.p1  ORF type:complete len:247 (+),score=77.79 GFUD01004336.1:231-971(+)
MTTNLKLGSNWKSCGVGSDMRRFDHGNSRINFGFCKGDDNFGGRKRKELDDFLKSLGKQMNLVMYRMQDTERIRSKLREGRRQDLRINAEREEEKEKMIMERLERNRKWRERKSGMDKLEDIAEDKVLDEKEERKLKNKEWREKRENQGKCEEKITEEVPKKQSLSCMILPELQCLHCHQEMAPPTNIYQCEDGHNICQDCNMGQDVQNCPLCNGKFVGRNMALETVAAMIILKKPKSEDVTEAED